MFTTPRTSFPIKDVPDTAALSSGSSMHEFSALGDEGGAVNDYGTQSYINEIAISTANFVLDDREDSQTPQHHSVDFGATGSTNMDSWIRRANHVASPEMEHQDEEEGNTSTLFEAMALGLNSASEDEWGFISDLTFVLEEISAILYAIYESSEEVTVYVTNGRVF